MRFFTSRDSCSNFTSHARIRFFLVSINFSALLSFDFIVFSSSKSCNHFGDSYFSNLFILWIVGSYLPDRYFGLFSFLDLVASPLVKPFVEDKAKR